MARVILDGFLIFAIPFLCYSAFLAYAARDPKAAFRIAHGPLIKLTLAGILLVIAVIIGAEMRAEHNMSGYQRAIWKDGQLIQGREK